MIWETNKNFELQPILWDPGAVSRGDMKQCEQWNRYVQKSTRIRSTTSGMLLLNGKFHDPLKYLPPTGHRNILWPIRAPPLTCYCRDLLTRKSWRDLTVRHTCAGCAIAKVFSSSLTVKMGPAKAKKSRNVACLQTETKQSTNWRNQTVYWSKVNS